jgi:hypothetical protein
MVVTDLKLTRPYVTFADESEPQNGLFGDDYSSTVALKPLFTEERRPTQAHQPEILRAVLRFSGTMLHGSCVCVLNSARPMNKAAMLAATEPTM